MTLEVEDVEASADFYRRLGLTQIVADYPDYARFRSPQGEATLSLHRTEHGSLARTASIHFEVDDVDLTVGRLKEAGFHFASDPVDQPYLWREAVLLDPDRNRIVTVQVREPPGRRGGEVRLT